MPYKRRITSWTRLNRQTNSKVQRDHFQFANGHESEQRNLFIKSSQQLLGQYRDALQMEDPSVLSGAKRFLQFMFEAWRSQKLCDVILHVQNGEELYAHKVALGAYSESLAEEFDRYPKNEVLALNLTEFPKEIVQDFLYFVYTTKVILGTHNIRELITLATELEVTVLIEICMNDLSNFDVENALFYYSILDDVDIPELRTRIYHYICEHFVDIVNTEEFVQITYERLYYLLSDASICIDSELDRFLAIVRWIDFDRAERLGMAPTLMQCVQFYKISPEVLVSEVEVETHIFEIRECHDMLYEAMKWHALSLSANAQDTYHLKASGISQKSSLQSRRVYKTYTGRASASSKFTTEKTKVATQQAPKMGTGVGTNPWLRASDSAGQRVTGSTSGYTTVMGTSASEGEEEEEGGNYRVQKSIILNNSRNQGNGQNLINLSPNIQLQTPTHVAVSPVRRAPQAYQGPQETSLLSTSMDSLLKPHDSGVGEVSPVCVGGLDVHSVDADKPGRCVYQYDASQNTWNLLTKMATFRHHHAAVMVAGKLCILGGAVYNKKEPDKLGVATGSVSVYDRESRQLTEATPMQHSRAYLAAVAHGSKIYAIGGEDSSKTKLASVEVYCAAFDSWKFLQTLRGGPKVGIAACVYRHCLWVVGGHNPDRPDGPILTDVECYDFSLQKWIPKKPLHLPVCHANLAVSMGKMYLIGGRSMRAEDRALVSLKSVYEYDDLSDTWRHASDMSIARHDCATSVVGTLMYIMGGMQSARNVCLDSVECFDTRTYTWLHNIAALPQPTAGLASATL